MVVSRTKVITDLKDKHKSMHIKYTIHILCIFNSYNNNNDKNNYEMATSLKYAHILILLFV